MHTISAPRVQLDPTRIASISGAIAINGLVLLLLLAPMTPVIKAVRDAQDVIIVPMKPKENPLPPKPDPTPINVEIKHPTPTIRPETRPVVIPPLPAEDAQPGDIKVPPVTSENAIADAGNITPPADDGKPLTGAHLEYAANPAPTYPPSSLRAQEQGTVLLEVLVDVDGRPIQVTISRSSGSRALDAAARRQVLANWRFRPAMRNGVAVQAIGIVPVDFRLE
ncbi:energy transducer TonB [Cognatilysobacter terrigena]|uniref:energy transducer TonB n=1 Tax=Cognatilysobacter terrigena TaxID=2488749 RepID=UPI00105E33E5|nr:energy transducer TonB [Lysobacter terrigena]